MPAEWWIEALRREHDSDRFDSGEVELNEYLARYARQNQAAGIARTFVAVDGHGAPQVLGYYSLAVGSIAKTDLPAVAVRG